MTEPSFIVNSASSTKTVQVTSFQRHGKLYFLPVLMRRLSGFRDEYISPIPEAERKDLILAYHAQLNSVDEETRVRAAKAWSKRE